MELIADPPIDFPALLEATRLYAQRKSAANAWVHPATWLHKKRWEDIWPNPPPKLRGHGTHPGCTRPFQPQRLNAR